MSCDSCPSFVFYSENGHCADPIAVHAAAHQDHVDIWKLRLKQKVDVEAEVIKLSLKKL